MRVVVVVAALVAVAVASPRERRQAPNECHWWEDCASERDPTEALVGSGPVPKNNEGREEAPPPSPGQGQGQGEGPAVRQNQEFQPCNQGRGTCVPYYLCNDGNIVTDGAGLIDIRLGPECPQFLDLCCSNPSTEPPTTPVYQPRCGVRNQNGVNVRITGFQENQAQFGEFPWMAAVLRKEAIEDKTVNLYVCGGSLIHPSVVLTAAHCVGNWNAHNLRVRLGEWDTQRTYEQYEHQDRDVQNVIIHPNYLAGPLHNDVALLFLDQPAILDPNVDTICLHPNASPYNCWATGWGTDKFGKDGEFQNVLKKIELNTWNNTDCQKALRTTRLGVHFILDKSFVCAGGLAGQDTCKGDGGSPLVCPLPDGRYSQSGIVAWGIGCGEGGIPGVYASVAHVYQWIINTADQELQNMGRYTPDYWNIN